MTIHCDFGMYLRTNATTGTRIFKCKSSKISYFYQRHAVSRTQQGKQKKNSVKTLRPHFPCSSGGIAC